MGDIINLNKARKDRDKTTRSARAKQNSVTFGQKKSEKKTNAGNRAKQSQKLDDHKLDGHSPEQPGGKDE